MVNTVESRYVAVKYNTVLQTLRQQGKTWVRLGTHKRHPKHDSDFALTKDAPNMIQTLHFTKDTQTWFRLCTHKRKPEHDSDFALTKDTPNMIQTLHLQKTPLTWFILCIHKRHPKHDSDFALTKDTPKMIQTLHLQKIHKYDSDFALTKDTPNMIHTLHSQKTPHTSKSGKSDREISGVHYIVHSRVYRGCLLGVPSLLPCSRMTTMTVVQPMDIVVMDAGASVRAMDATPSSYSASMTASKGNWRKRHSHDDVINGTFFCVTDPFVRGTHRWPLDSPHKDQIRRAYFFFITAWTNGWANKEAPVIWDAIALVMTSL